MTHWIRQYGGSLLIVVLAFAYITRMYNLHVPEKYMFDEVYHAVTAKLIAQNDPRAYEWWNPPPEPDTAVDWLHPPLAKYFQALSILAFGENSFGWRFSSVVFGVLVIVATYHLTMRLFNNQAHAVAAAALASLDGLLLVQSRIAMNDIFVTFFMLLSLLFYARYRQDRSNIHRLFGVGVLSGLAISTKWSGLFILATIVLLEGLRLLEYGLKSKWRFLQVSQWQATVKKFLVYVLALFIIPAVVYVLSYSHMFLQGKDLTHFKELHSQIWYYQTHLEAEHPYQSRPWQWALNLRPVWYNVEYLSNKRSDVYAFGNPALFWLGIAAIGYSLVIASTEVLSRTKNKRTLQTKLLTTLKYLNTSPLTMAVVAYGMVWIPWQLSPRIMFFYHYTPAVPFLCIILAYWLRLLYKEGGLYKHSAVLMWLIIGLCFAVWYPHWIGVPITTDLKEAIYFSIPSWK